MIPVMLLGLLAWVVAQDACIQTGSINYPCPPFPPQWQPHPGIEAQMDPRPDFGLETYVGSDKLLGKVAIITGGDSGIGRAVALAFAREGADVVISYLNEDEDAEEILSHIEDAGRQGLIIPGDIRNVEHVQYIIDKTVRTFGKIDILVNNAGTAAGVEDLLDLTHARILYTFQVNVLAMYDFAIRALPHMGQGGAIINTASGAAYYPIWELLDYSGSKGAVVSFTKGLAQYTITKGIRTNAVAPGPVWTPIVVTAMNADSVVWYGLNSSALHRPAQPAELAPTYVYLASEDSTYTNGAILGIGGPWP